MGIDDGLRRLPGGGGGRMGLTIRIIGALLFATSIALNMILWSRSRSGGGSDGVILIQDGGLPKSGSTGYPYRFVRRNKRKRGTKPPVPASKVLGHDDGNGDGSKRKTSEGTISSVGTTAAVVASNDRTGPTVEIGIGGTTAAIAAPTNSTRPTVDIGIGGSDISKEGRDVTPKDWRMAYELSLARFHNRTAAYGQSFTHARDLRKLLGLNETSDRVEGAKTPVIQLLRMPKGASTHLSITGRALAGCSHPGYPCCIKKHDGEMCPKEGLFCGWVKNCVGHGSLHEPTSSLAKITQLRNPAERLLSGFFYWESVHNKHHKGCATWQCFTEYLSDMRVRNGPMTKMLLGRYVYHNSKVKPGEVEVAKQNLCRLAWFGMLDMPLASKLLLYEQDPFNRLQPHPVVFDLPPDDGSIVIESHHLRKNINSTYDDFVKGDYIDKGGLELIVSLNEYEFDLYAFSWGLFCARIRESGLLQYADKFESAHHFDECLKSKYDVPAKDYCPQDR